MKKCTCCKIEKDYDNFHKSKRSKDGFYNVCKTCKKDYDKKYRKSDKIQNLYKSEEYKKHKRETGLERSNKNHEKLLLRLAKNRAKKMNLPFNLEESDIIVPDICPILDIPLFKRTEGFKSERRAPRYNTASIDRIVPKLGYVKGNIMIISVKANVMKNNATIEELLTFAKNVIKIYGNDNSVLPDNTDNT